MFRRALVLAALAFSAVPSIALADTTGSAGYVMKLQANQPSADTYLTFHGRVFIGVAKGGTEYRWGGATCGTRTVSDASVQLLMHALDSGLHVEPIYQIGQGDLRCLIGFSTFP